MSQPGPGGWNPAQLDEQLEPEQIEGLRDVMAIVARHPKRMEDSAKEALRKVPELAAVYDPNDPEAADRSARDRQVLMAGIEAGNLSEYLAAVRERAKDAVVRRVRFPAVAMYFRRSLPAVYELLVEELGDDRPRLLRALKGLNHLTGLIMGAVGSEYAEVRESLLQEEYHRILRELSVPVIPIWEGVLVVPLIGVVDSTRARQMTETLLESIVETKARVVILDITGVPAVDTQVADYLIRAVKAARLLGSDSILVGIRPAIARTLVHLGVDLRDVRTEATLQAGLELAFRTLGYRVERDAAHG